MQHTALHSLVTAPIAKSMRNPVRTLFNTSIALLVGLCLVPGTSQAADQNVVVILDDSGSMGNAMRSVRKSRMDAAKDALLQVLRDLPDDAVVGVIALNTRVSGSNWVIPLGPIDKSRIEQQVSQISARGGTPLGAAMRLGADALLEARDKQAYGTYRLLIVTDGEATDPALVRRYLPVIISRSLVTDVIGVDMSSNHQSPLPDSYM